MSNYIMNRESLKRHCEKMCDMYKNVPTSGTYSEHRFVLDLLEQTRWIPVSERLPEEDGCYLVTTTGTNNDIIDIAYYTDGIWHKASRIKAWMPLPQPYRAESEELKGEQNV